MTFITHWFRVSVISNVRERAGDLASPLRFMLRRSSLVECVSVLHARIFFSAWKLTFEISYGTTRVRLNDTRFDSKKSRPRYISTQKILTLF
jgi:hypothetical protein